MTETTTNRPHHARVLRCVLITIALAATACDGGSEAGAPSAPQPARHPEGRYGADAVFGRIPDIVRDVRPSVVAILTDRGEGSGVVWEADGTIVTNHHVVAAVQAITVGFADGKRSPAKLLAADPLTDLAVLRTERQGLPAARFARELPQVGELAIAIGNPLGFENSVTAGIVSGLHRSIPGSAAQTPALVDLLQTDAAISPGNSGGGLVDAEGRVIGINVAHIPPGAQAVAIGFAIPAPTVRDVVGQLLEEGTVSHAFLGVVPAPLTPQIAERLGVAVEQGVVVLDVAPGGPAAAAGIAPGDVITAVGGDRVESVEELFGILRRHGPGETIAVRLVRDGDRMERAVELAERPQMR